MRTLMLVVAMMAVPFTWLHAHGGQNVPSGDASGGLWGGVAKPAAPTNPPGRKGKGPAAPVVAKPIPAPGGAITRGDSKRSGSPRRAASTGPMVEFSVGMEGWEFWWDANKDDFLRLKQRATLAAPISGSVGHLTGRGRSTGRPPTRRPPRARIDGEVLPTLQALLEADDPDIVDSAILALGRTTEREAPGDLVPAVTTLLSHRALSVQTSAVLALGVHGSPEAVDLLTDLMHDRPAGRKAVGGDAVPWLVSSLAAVSLGLIDAPGTVPRLAEVLSDRRLSSADLQACAVVALGQLSGANSEPAVELLLELLDDRRLDRHVAAFVPTSLGKLGDARAIAPLVAAFRDRDTDDAVRRSVAIALGRLKPTGDVVVDVLGDYVAGGRDVMTRHYALISLGRIGGRLGPDDRTVTKLLAREITRPSHRSHRPWAAIAGAISARGDVGRSSLFVECLSDAYDDEKNPSSKAAFAIALGLMEAEEASARILEDFHDMRDEEFRGYAAVALGLMGHEDAAPALRQACQSRTLTPSCRMALATGLGLLGDPEAVPVLIETLESGRTLGVSGAAAKALGLVGDERAISPLRKVAADPGRNTLTRAFAAVALGIVAEKSDLPWNAPIRCDNNYVTSVSGIDEVLDIL